MATKLRDILRLTGVAPGVTNVLHGLNIEGQPVTPDKIETATSGSFMVSATNLALTVRNLGGAASDIDIYVEHFHSVDRVFDVGDEEMTPQPFIQSGGLVSPDGSNFVRFADDGGTIDVYVDGVNGDDENDGTTEGDPLQTITAVYRKFPVLTYQDSQIRINLAGVDGFADRATAPLEYEVSSILLGGRGKSYSNTWQYVGPEMVPVTPTTGPATAALDTPPAVAVAGGSPSAGGTRSVRFDFTGAAPGWTVNDFQGKYLRITRGGEKVVYEMPIAKNDADTITVRVTGVAPLINNTDTAEIVEPGAQIVSIGGSTPLITGESGGGYVGTGGFGAAFLRCEFPMGFHCMGVRPATFDRCNVDPEAWSSFFEACSVAFFNCVGQYLYMSGCRLLATTWLDPAPSGAGDPINNDYGMDLQLCGNWPTFLLDDSSLMISYGLAIEAPYDEPLIVRARSTLYLYNRSGWEIASLQGECDDTGHAIVVQTGGRCELQSNVANAGATSLYCTGGGDPLFLDDGAGLSCDYGNGVGEWEEAAGYAGVLWQAPAAGAFADPESIIRTT